MHRFEVSILRTLRRSESARFSDLMRPTGLSSDVFKFHLRKLVKLGHVEKTDDGMYRLTATGKEFANNLDEVARSVQKQPKLSVLLVVSRPDGQGSREFLFQERLRNPYLHYWGFISGPIRWGEPTEAAASRELAKQTGLTADFSVKAFCRTTDYSRQTGRLLEDKLFIIMTADQPLDEPDDSWGGGNNAWLVPEALRAKEHYYETTFDVLEHLQAGDTYFSLAPRYDDEDY